jgi:hypothetical protein
MKEYLLNCVANLIFETTEWAWIKLVLGSTLNLLRSEINFGHVFSKTLTLYDFITCVHNTKTMVCGRKICSDSHKFYLMLETLFYMW